MPAMPNLVGTQLSGVQTALQAAGVLDLNAIGYFGTWPIRVNWQPNASRKGAVTAQTPAPGPVSVNPAINLTVSEYPMGAVYP